MNAASAAFGVFVALLAPELSWSAREDARTAPALARQAPAETAPPQGETDAPRVDARAREALERGLRYLAARQAVVRDGGFPLDDAEQRAPVAVTALGALAFMASGSQPDRGPYGKSIAAAIDYLCAHAELTEGSPSRGFISSDGDANSRMHGHGFATLALSQAFSMSPKTARGERLGKVLPLAVLCIEKSQGLEGGWEYVPRVSIGHENSVTITLVQALRGAHNVGVKVDPNTIARAVDYVTRCQNENGSFRYGLVSKDTTLALTAASLSTLNAIGRYGTPEVERGMTNLWQGLESVETGEAGVVRFPYYERMYVAEALWHHRDLRLFERWMERELPRLITSQAADGSWTDTQFGSCYATASNCLVLALPLGQLPIFQR
ncbi:MAG: terpene cyclase/mutase family protein [Planctomycetes bacterium]|nr:terpene cyclase/mutase family protein [Planctomycetota bacterium]